jgi:hypothetical protein
MRQASMMSSRISSFPRAAIRALIQWNRWSDSFGHRKVSGRLSISAARSSFGNPKPNAASSGEIEA